MDELNGELENFSTSTTWEDLGTTISEQFGGIWDDIKASLGFGGSEEAGGVGEIFTGIVDGMLNAVNKRWPVLQQNLQTKLINLWAWASSPDGPFAKMAGAFDQMIKSAEDWLADENNKAKLELLGSSISGYMVEGIKLWWSSGDEVVSAGAAIGTAITNRFIRIIDLQRSAMVDVLKGFVNNLFGVEGTLPTLILVTASYWLKAATNPMMFVSEAIEATMAAAQIAMVLGWNKISSTVNEFIEKVKGYFYDLYIYLVGASIVPDMVNDILGWVDTLTSGFTTKITELRDNVVGLFTEIINKAGETISSVSEVASSTASNAIESGKDLLPEWLRNRLPKFDVGAYNVPRDMAAIVHKGEMIVPADQANQIRNSTTNNRFEPGAFVFPNVRTARDAQGVMDEIQRQISLGSLKAQTV